MASSPDERQRLAGWEMAMKLSEWNYGGATAFDGRANYMGADLRGLLVAPIGQHRDSDALDRSNFTVGLAQLGGESETVQVHRFGNWAVGWSESILIDPSDTVAVAVAEKMADRLDSYPVLDEEHYSDLERSEAEAYWAGMSVQGRMEYCGRAGVSIFAARRDYIPADTDGYMEELLRG